MNPLDADPPRPLAGVERDRARQAGLIAPNAVLSEQCNGFITVWHCQPPEMSRSYQVLDQEWWADAALVPERHIYRWRYAGEGGSGELMGRAAVP